MAESNWWSNKNSVVFGSAGVLILCTWDDGTVKTTVLTTSYLVGKLYGIDLLISYSMNAYSG